jgi:predicted  nucleic acid-binding Zn-ribbon protein
MSESTSREQLEELTNAISMLLPAITSLEDRLRSIDTAALARQREMAEALERIASELDILISRQHALSEALASTDRRLSEDAEQRAALAPAITELLRLLRDPP